MRDPSFFCLCPVFVVKPDVLMYKKVLRPFSTSSTETQVRCILGLSRARSEATTALTAFFVLLDNRVARLVRRREVYLARLAAAADLDRLQQCAFVRHNYCPILKKTLLQLYV